MCHWEKKEVAMNNGLCWRALTSLEIIPYLCGIVSVNVRGVTLHLTEDAFGIFSSMVGERKQRFLTEA